MSTDWIVLAVPKADPLVKRGQAKEAKPQPLKFIANEPGMKVDRRVFVPLY